MQTDPTRVCQNCGKTFAVKYPTNPNRFCSRSCSTQFNQPQRKTGTIEVPCEACGKIMKLYPSQARKRRYCSNECGYVGFAQNTSFTPEEDKKLADRYRAGTSIRQLARQTGRHSSTVRNALLREGAIDPKRRLHGDRRTLDGDNYPTVRIDPDDPMWPMAHKRDGRIKEHRLIMARFLGRPLTANETVHHIDGDKQNNAIENLQLRQGSHGRGICFKCGDCGSFNIIEEPLKGGDAL